MLSEVMNLLRKFYFMRAAARSTRVEILLLDRLKGRTKRFVLCFYSSSEIALRIAASCCSTASSRLLSSSGFSPLMASVSTALT